MLDVEGTELSSEERDMLLHPLVGGVILFTRNYASPEQLSALVADIHAVREPRLLVAVDHEGGRVQRFREGFTRLPAARCFGALYDRDPRRASHLAEVAGWLMAAELRSVGVDFSFAPVLDIDRGVSDVIGDRAWHGNPEVVAELAHNFMIGMRRAGMAATGKHFPGHGAVAEDSHVAIPHDDRSFTDIYADEVLPFERMIQYGLAAIMPAHVIYTKVDPRPAGFSKFWLQDVLRKRLGFQGVIFSDDLSMAGAETAGGYLDRARAALEAGCDMLLICNNRAAALEVLRGLQNHNDPVSHMRMARMHGRHEHARNDLLRDPQWKQAVHELAMMHRNDDPGWEM